LMCRKKIHYFSEVLYHHNLTHLIEVLPLRLGTYGVKHCLSS
jgi:hypothetical protein